MNNLNGLLFTGGKTSLWKQLEDTNYEPSHYLKKVKSMIDYAKEINDGLTENNVVIKKKRYFMLWGICLGMHSLVGTISMKKELTFVDNDKHLHQEAG